MNCKKFASVMSEYLDGGLAGHVRLNVEVHVEECNRCAEELAAMEVMLASLKSLRADKAPVDCWHGVKSKILDRQPARLGAWPWLFRSVYTVPALALVIMMVLLFMLPGYINDQPVGNQVSIPEYTQYISAHSRAQRGQALSDPHVAFIAAELEKASLTTEP